MISDEEIFIEDEIFTPDDKELMRRVLFDELPEDLAELADYSE